MSKNENNLSHFNNDPSDEKKRLRNKRNKNADLTSMSKAELINEVIKTKKELERINKILRR